MNTIDNALQALLKMAHKEVLWINSSPTSSFPAQTISIPSAPDALLVEIYTTTTTTHMVSSIVPYVISKNTVLRTTVNSNENSALMLAIRELTIATNKLIFGKGYLKAPSGELTEANTRVIPYKVVGIFF